MKSKPSSSNLYFHNGHRILISQYGDGTATGVVDFQIGLPFYRTKTHKIFIELAQRFCRRNLE